MEQQGVVTLDEEKKAAMVNNLLVALLSETEAQPIINMRGKIVFLVNVLLPAASFTF